MSNTLIVRTPNNEVNISLTGNAENIAAFIMWVDYYHHGTYNGTDSIVCKTPRDLFACKQKAIREKLLPQVSKSELKPKFTSM